MSDLPSGVVTFLFTDIEGSTRLWEQHPQAMLTALTRHDAILRECIAAAGGVVFRTVGDAFCAAFTSAPAALAASLAAQRAFYTEPWGETGPLRVRMAIHTGAVEVRGADYVGRPLNRVARLLAVGHGGQTLLSHATEELVRHELPPGMQLRAMGEHRLRDLIRPERIFQLVALDLPADFPPLRILDHPAAPPGLAGAHAVEGVSDAGAHTFKQAKLPGMPGIDYDAVLEKERARLRRRRGRKEKTDDSGEIF